MRTVPFFLAPLLAGCIAHFPKPDEPMAFMEASYAGTAPGAGQIFEAEPAIHVYFANGLDDEEVQAKGGFAATTSFSFLAAIRMLDEPSTPVRTPSYEPRMKLQLLGLTAPSGEGERVTRLLGALEVAAAHYSNGQKGCALADHVRRAGDSDFDCIPQTSPPSTALNTLDGSFTTHYLSGGLGLKWMGFPRAGGAASWGLALSATGEWHVPCRVSGCMDREMRERYGEYVGRWGAEADVVVLRGLRYRLPFAGPRVLSARLRASVRGTVHFPEETDPFGSVTFEAAFVPRHAGGIGWGPFVRLHRGRDPLNIRFEERLDVWSVGLLFDPAPPETIPLRVE